LESRWSWSADQAVDVKNNPINEAEEIFKMHEGKWQVERTGPKCWAVGPLRIYINESVIFTKEVYSLSASNADMNNNHANSMY
jgi:hypothetical protein